MDSPEHSHPFIMVIGKESNEIMKEKFKYMLDFFKRCFVIFGASRGESNSAGCGESEFGITIGEHYQEPLQNIETSREQVVNNKHAQSK